MDVDVAHSSDEQNRGISQINIAISQMDQVTQANAASAEESAAAAEELNAQATTMRHSVADLLHLVGADSPALEPETQAGKICSWPPAGVQLARFSVSPAGYPPNPIEFLPQLLSL